MLYYCIPDIHGRNDLLQKALDYIYTNNRDGCKIIFLGDYIDRGNDNLGVLHTVMNPPEGYEFVTLMGNHEDMFIDSYQKVMRFYDTNAAMQIAGETPATIKTVRQLVDAIDPKYIEWMKQLKLFHIEDGKNVFAHAYYTDYLKPEQQIKSECLWTRMNDFMSYNNPKQGLYLTHGHTPRKNGPITTTYRTNLDAGAVFYDRLVIAEYRKDKTGPQKFIDFV